MEAAEAAASKVKSRLGGVCAADIFLSLIESRKKLLMVDSGECSMVRRWLLRFFLDYR
jgi:hypothetical protein